MEEVLDGGRMNNPFTERVVVLVKPDGVLKGLIGEVIKRFEQRGLKLVALKMVWPTREHIDEHYPKDQAWIERLGTKSLKTYQEHGIDPKKELGTDDPKKIGPQVREWLVHFMTKSPVVAMVWEGTHAVSVARKISGETIPAQAAVGTIRGDFAHDSPAAANVRKGPVENIVHVSETAEEAKHEIEHWFSPEELYDYERP
jgi:nucleoside-diphosphate kinase